MRAIQRTRSRTSNQPACNFALFTLLLEDDFQSETVNFARLQLPSTYNFPNKWGAGMIGADVARSTPVRNCFGTGRTFTWNHSRKQDGWVSIRGRRPRFERRPEAVSEDYAMVGMVEIVEIVEKVGNHRRRWRIIENMQKERPNARFRCGI